MSLKNEARQAYQHTRSLYQDYTRDMNRETLGRDFSADSNRLKALYREAIGVTPSDPRGQDISLMTKFDRLTRALALRMSPVRRLIFGVSMIGFISHYVMGFFGFQISILIPFVSFAGMVMLLLVELLEKLDAKKEIDLARDIQLSLLPAASIRHESIDIVSFANTASEVGGDYVDIIKTEKGFYYIIADVSGKGLSAALYMVRMQALVHLLINKFEPTPKQLCLELNEYIKNDRRDKTFVTACVAFFPDGEDYFEMVRAGHNSPILYSMSKDAVLDLKTTGFALGMTTTKRLEAFMKQMRVSFKEGDSLLMYTDGLNEARNPFGEEFGDTKIRSLVELYGSLEAKTMIHKLQIGLEQFIGSASQGDDITFSCIKKNPGKTMLARVPESAQEV
ncbi:MAG: SpoIIE family protein phosphatase [Bacteroidetes bacterium]|nr:SpoIIE family protein phosphatase [Bacteroidota bacterium]MCH8525035.1 SpoIIE family protein phosphatase [Balneolales bacterium]